MPIDSVILLSRLYSKEIMQIGVKTFLKLFILALFTTMRNGKLSQNFTIIECLNKLWDRYRMDYYKVTISDTIQKNI